MKKYLIYFLFCFQGVINLYGQVDKTFWFAVPEVTSLHADRPIFLQLASNEKASEVLISIPANTDFVPLLVRLDANELKSVDMTPFIELLENKIPNAITNQGVLIEASEEITAYYEVRGTNPQGIVNTDIFALKGENALGTEFYLPFQNLKGNNYNHYGKNGWSSADIVAIEDGTEITIKLTKAAVGHDANSVFTITLQKGQTYSLRAAGQLAEDRLVGTYIKSTKPIAITVKDDSVAEHQNINLFPAADLIGDQLIPLHILGTEYILAEGTVYILATEDNTDLLVGGVTQADLARGEQRMIDLGATPVFIESSAPIYVLHIINQNNEYGGAILPPVQCTGSQKVSFIRPSSQGFELTVLVKKGGEDSFVINGKKSVGLTKEAFQEVPNTNGEWLYASRDLVELNIGVNTIENTRREFHLGIKGRTGGSSYYGYFSNFGNLDLGLDVNACQGDDISLSAGEGRDTYEWSTGETTSSITLSSENVVKDSLVWVKITEGQCKAQDTVSVTVGEAVLGIDLGENIELCEGEIYTISLPEKYTYVWNDGSPNREYVITNSGKYEVVVSSQDGCTFTDSIGARFVPLPIANLGNDTLICEGQNLNLTLTEGYSSYQWSTGNNTTNTLIVNEMGTYSVQVMTQTKNKICGIDQDEITVGFWDVHTYNVVTPNEDGKNDVFIVDGIEEGDWQLEVYNRWGQRIYYDKHYANTWNPSALSAGTYFFSLTESQEASCNQFTNWVQIIK